MKRVLLALLGILAVVDFCFSQQPGVPFEQRGNATQEMQASGMNAAHASLNVGAMARVINVITGDEVDVRITRRIQQSSDRIVDLSPDAAAAINLTSGGPVLILSPPPVRPEPIVEEVASVPDPIEEPTPVIEEVVVVDPIEEPAPVIEEVAAVPEPVVETPPPPPVVAAPARPITITIHNFVVTPDLDVEQPRPEPAPIVAETPSPETVREPLPTVQPVPEMAWGAPAMDIVVIPGLPDPYSDKMFRLQVGAYSGAESAAIVNRMLEAAGFTSVQESHGNVIRVLIAGIHASDVQSAVYRLASIGFAQVWVRE